MSTGKSMAELVQLVGGRLRGDDSPTIIDVTHRSDQAAEGVLFVAIEGATADGHDYVTQAVAQGASAVAVTRDVGVDAPTLIVDDTRAVLGPLAAAVHDDPSRAVDVVGVTGTNGKTTVTHFIDSITRQTGLVSGMIGTISVKIGDEEITSSRTTPEASELQRLLAQMQARSVTTVAAEVSSHALRFGRVDGTRFKVAAFTNLSQDHLDFHGSMEEYGAAKKLLFTEHEVETAVVYIDDPLGIEIAGDFEGEIVTVGLLGDVNFSDLEVTTAGTRFRFSSPWGSETVEAPVFGEFNVANLTIAVACCLTLGMEFESVMRALPSIAQVPGRFEIVSGSDPLQVIVDYAHTPEGVALAVETARSISDGRVIALVGAGGDRDRDKRPRMGEALALADVAIVTSDNPRSEDPEEIVDAVASGVSGTALIVEVDREKAIRRALAQGSDGDIVLILGRGHEPRQQFADRQIDFDDREVARRLLNERRGSANLGRESGSMST